MNVLIVEDDTRMAKIIQLYLQRAGYNVAVVGNGRDAMIHLQAHRIDIVILDWMLPIKSGIEVCAEIRSQQLPVKVMMVTAKTTTDDEIASLSTGADDYLRKPFEMRVLLARLQKLHPVVTKLTYHTLVVDLGAYEVQKDGEVLPVTKKEYELLVYFLQHQNQVLSREQILSAVWGFDYTGDVRTVDTHIRRLRQKIGDELIQTRIGIGYLMERPHE